MAKCCHGKAFDSNSGCTYLGGILEWSTIQPYLDKEECPTDAIWCKFLLILKEDLHGQIVGIETHAIATVDVLVWAASLSGELENLILLQMETIQQLLFYTACN